MNVLIISDVRLHRDGLARLLKSVPSVNVVGAIDIGGSSQRLSVRAVDALLIDVLSLQSLRTVQPWLRRRRRVPIIAVGVREEESEVLALAAAGIDGYVPLDAAVEDVVHVLDSVLRRELVCSPKVAASLYNCAAVLTSIGAEPLTVRELEVIDLLNAGHSNKEIARKLGIEAATAKNHVQNILQKLNVHRRGQAAAKLRTLIRERLGPGAMQPSVRAVGTGGS